MPKTGDFQIADNIYNLEFNQTSNSYNLITEKLNLCPGEKFIEQPARGAFCSGSLVAEDIILTAEHCIETSWECQDTKFIFNFAIKQKNDSVPTTISANEVYSCKEIIKTRLYCSWPQIDFYSCVKPDYVLIKLDRPVTGRNPLAINRNQNLTNGTPLFVIGHPQGLPVKIAGDAIVRNISYAEEYFTADLDTFKGNSGSPVFNANTNLIEGILVGGDNDFVYDAKMNCNRVYVKPQDGGKGEKVLMISAPAQFIP